MTTPSSRLLKIILEHEIAYDSFDQNADSWYCKAKGCRFWHRSREKGLEHVAELLVAEAARPTPEEDHPGEGWRQASYHD